MAAEKKSYKLTTELAREIIARKKIRPDEPGTQPGDPGNGRVLVIDETHQKFNGIIYKRSVHSVNQNVRYIFTADRICYLHVDVWTFHNGKPPKKYIVHHEHRCLDGNFNQDENNIEWLFLLKHSEHISYHRFAGPYVKKICQNPKCGKEFWTLGYGSKYCSDRCFEASKNVNPKMGSNFITPDIARHLEKAINNDSSFFADAGRDKYFNKMETRICFYCHRPFNTIANRPAIMCRRPDCIGHNLLIAIAKTQYFIMKRIEERNKGWQTFRHKEFGKLDVVVIDGEAWFIGKQVATMLGYANTRDAIIRLVEDDDKKLLTYDEIQRSGISTFASPRGLMLINEFGMNDLILDSQLPAAKRIRHWITHEVMPSLRRRGTYSFTEHLPTAADYLSEEEMRALIAFRKRNGDDNHALTALNELSDKEQQLVFDLIDLLHTRRAEPPTVDVTPAEG